MTTPGSFLVRHSSTIFWTIPLLNFFSLTILIIFSAFYFAPAQIVLATRASAIAAVAPLISMVLPYRERFWSLRSTYFRILSAHTGAVLICSVVLFLVLAIWGLVMFDEIRRRYEYVEAVNRAISLVDADQIAIPDPSELAAAYSIMPSRPEVPFIVARSVRILSPDDKLEPFHKYMQTFTNALDKDAILNGSRSDERRKGIRLDDERSIPVVDPVEMLAQYMIEVPEADQKVQYLEAIKILEEAAQSRPDEVGLEVDKLMLLGTKDTELDVVRPDQKSEVLERYISELGSVVEKSIARSNAYDRRFLLSASYQEALDALANWNLEKALSFPVTQDPSTSGCGKSVDEARQLFSRLMTLRRRLMVSDDVIWWRAPAKLSIFHYFAWQSGYVSTIADDFKKRSSDTCPLAWKMLVELYSANGFKVFQDPEQWSNGTPLATSFNGALTAAQLRKWLKLGW